ncbi:MAG: hypothetical protein AB8H80_13995 [Planctomycetota bacterium]
MNVNEHESPLPVGRLTALARIGAVVLAVGVVAWMVWHAQGQASPVDRGAAGAQPSAPQVPATHEPGKQGPVTQEPATDGVRSQEMTPLTPEQLLLSSSKSIVIDYDPPPVVLSSSKFMALPKTEPSKVIKQLNELLQEHAKTEKAAVKKEEGKKAEGKKGQ